MGYYTEFKFKGTLREKNEINLLLDKIVNHPSELEEELTGKPQPVMRSVYDGPNLPIEHEFGKCPRWSMLFHSNNFDPEHISGSRLENNELTIHTEFKNYDDEIRKFIDWIKPYVIEIEECWEKGEDSEEGYDLKHYFEDEN